MPALVSSVNVVHALVPDTRGDLDLTAIDKRRVAGRVRVGPLGLEGDEQVDKRHHGGVEQAVYAYAAEDAAWWSEQLGRDITPGQFGENLTTRGLDVTGATLGERWQVGDDGLVLEVASARIPCRTFQGWMDEPHWVKRFTEHGAPGAYLQVVQPGTVGEGDRIEIVHRPDHGVTVGEVLVIRRADEDKLRRALDDPGVRGQMADAIRHDLTARARAR
ncbi:MAG: MOSC domain-containing protein [Actinomycetes bacterium]